MSDWSIRLVASALLLGLGGCDPGGGTMPEPEPTLTDPPYSGTIFIDPDIITSADPTAFEGLTFAGQEARTMYDRRVEGWVTVDAFLFDARYDDGLAVEIQVNPELGTSAAAEAPALAYGEVIGRLPTALRREVETVWIHEGTEPFGGGNNNLLIHVGQAALYEADGILEETLVHEATHTSVDPTHAAAGGWVSAQQADPTFISTYARDYPTREDLAETMVPYIAVRYRADRITAGMTDTIAAAVPNRIQYLDAQAFEMYPLR